MAIHATAVVDSKAELGAEVEIGPYAVIEGDVVLADGVVVGPHSVVRAGTSVGARTWLDAHVVLGGAAQDLRRDRAGTRLIVGDDNVFRSFSTAHAGALDGIGETRIGHRNYFMANSHVAHDCRVGDDCVLANAASVGGHVEVGNRVMFGSLSTVHQHCRVGRLAMVGAGAVCTQDVPPFTLAQGDRARLYGLNVIGLRRADVGIDAMAALKHAWRTLFSMGLPLHAGIGVVRDDLGDFPEVAELLAFVAATTRGVCRGASAGA